MLKRMLVATALLSTAAVIGLSGIVSCGGASVPKINCTSTPPKKYSELSIVAKCTNCHSSARTAYAADPNNPSLPDPNSSLNQQSGGRHGATPGYDYDTYQGTKMVATQAQDDLAGSPPGLHLMPPSNDPRWKVDGGGAPPNVTDAEKTDFYAWVQCGMPN